MKRQQILYVTTQISLLIFAICSARLKASRIRIDRSVDNFIPSLDNKIELFLTTYPGKQSILIFPLSREREFLIASLILGRILRNLYPLPSKYIDACTKWSIEATKRVRTYKNSWDG